MDMLGHLNKPTASPVGLTLYDHVQMNNLITQNNTTLEHT